MKKIQYIFAFGITFLPYVVFAAELSEILKCNGPCRLSDVLPMIKALNSYIAFNLIPPLAIIAFGYAGLTMILGTGNPGEVKKAKDIMYYAVVGLIVAFAAYYIVDLIVTGLTGGSADSKVNEFLNK